VTRPVRAAIVTQARMTSTRLPGKILLEAAGKPLLVHHLERLARAREAAAVIVATTTNATDDPVAELAGAMGFAVARGDEEDVLSRFMKAMELTDADTVVRVTSDCPLIDPVLIDALIRRYREGRTETPPIDYISIDVTRYPRGFDAEVFGRALLEEAAREATQRPEREHVTPYIYRRPERFRLAGMAPESGSWSYRLCVDEPADFALVRRVLESVPPETPFFGWQDCCKLLDSHPEWVDINRTVQQRTAH